MKVKTRDLPARSKAGVTLAGKVSTPNEAVLILAGSYSIMSVLSVSQR